MKVHDFIKAMMNEDEITYRTYALYFLGIQDQQSKVEIFKRFANEQLQANRDHTYCRDNCIQIMAH